MQDISLNFKISQMKTIKNVVLFAVMTVMSCADKKNVETNETEIIGVKLFEIQHQKNGSDIETSGLITTENESKLSFKIGGVIDKIFVKEGQSFKSGQLLATLNQTEIEAQVIQARLAVEKSKRDFARVRNLYKDSVATLEQLQNTKTGLEISEKALEQANFNRRYACIYATSSGFTSKKTVNEGEIIQGGSPVFIVNENNNQKNWIVKVGVSEKDWLKIRENNSCRILSNDNQFNGIISQKSQAIDAGSGTFLVEIKILNPTNNLAVGMFAKVMIRSSDIGKTTAIPYDAVIEANGKNAFVFIPNSKTSVKKIPIVIESFSDKEVLVASGLENQKNIIVGNSPFLNENSKIKILK